MTLSRTRSPPGCASEGGRSEQRPTRVGKKKRNMGKGGRKGKKNRPELVETNRRNPQAWQLQVHACIIFIKWRRVEW